VPSVSLSATDFIRYNHLFAIARRTEPDRALEYMMSGERYGLLTSQHAKKAEKCDRWRCRRPNLNEPIDDPDGHTQDQRSEIRPHRMLLASDYRREPIDATNDPCSQSATEAFGRSAS
jgi:hypothetical protein